MILHAGDLTTKETLCGLDLQHSNCKWAFTEKDMKLSKGQMFTLFKSMVTCETCLSIAKETRVKETCEKCGKEI